MKISVSDLKLNCRYFRGDVPCKPHKDYGVHCLDESGNDCIYFEAIKKKILIIKLGAIGDVIRTTPLLRKLKLVEPHAEIWWLTSTPEVIPDIVDVTVPFTAQNVVVLQSTSFDAVYNLDKDKEACAICSLLKSENKRGFTLRDGKCVPINAVAEHKYMTGVFDDISKSNEKSYQEEIFEICGFEFNGEQYIMPNLGHYNWKLKTKKKIVGLNTGCGGRWKSRLWPDAYWISLSKKLNKAGFFPLLLGGEEEHKKNLKLARLSGAKYLGYFPLQQFMSLINQCHLVVTAVTMAMHVAIGLHKKIVLFNNIFNKSEFELYGQGEILEPDIECNCFYNPNCPNNCMQYLSVDRVFDSCQRLLSQN